MILFDKQDNSCSNRTPLMGLIIFISLCVEIVASAIFGAIMVRCVEEFATVIRVYFYFFLGWVGYIFERN